MGTNNGDIAGEKSEVAPVLEWDRRLEAFAADLRAHGMDVHVDRQALGSSLGVRISITITPGA